MRYIAFGVALLAVGAATQAQAPGWNMYEAPGKGDFKPIQVFVQGTNGTQLIIKCDKPGQFETYAIVATQSALSASIQGRFEIRPVRIRFDGGAAIDDTWRFSGSFASAFDDRSQRTMTRFVQKLVTASKVEIQLEPFRQAPVQASFDVANGKDAINQVYTSCKDKTPVP